MPCTLRGDLPLFAAARTFGIGQTQPKEVPPPQGPGAVELDGPDRTRPDQTHRDWTQSDGIQWDSPTRTGPDSESKIKNESLRPKRRSFF